MDLAFHKLANALQQSMQAPGFVIIVLLLFSLVAGTAMAVLSVIDKISIRFRRRNDLPS